MSPVLPSQNPIGRVMTIFGAVTMGTGLGGFLVGIAEPVRPTRATHREAVVAASAPAVPSYRDIRSSEVGPNHDWKSHFASLKQDSPGLFDSVDRTPAMKDAALQDRLRTRAFDGAPPVIPHRVEQQLSTSCLACHGNGLKLGDKIATKVSHPHFANCLQCHVEQSGGLPTVAQEQLPQGFNKFAGVLRSGPGLRAMPGSPPTIPHTLHLRNDCMSCHGLIARRGLRTTHPWLQNCLQCHALDASAERPKTAEPLQHGKESL